MAELISEEYRAMQKSLHAAGGYGTVGATYAPQVERLIEQYKPRRVLDYGAGSQMSLGRALSARRKVNRQFEYVPYEPAVERYADAPEPADLVVCIDVLEHVEPECLGNVLDDLQRVTQAIGLFSVHCKPAMKTLPDGRNAHLIQQPPEWWLPIIMQRFTLQTFQRQPNGFAVLVSPL